MSGRGTNKKPRSEVCIRLEKGSLASSLTKLREIVESYEGVVGKCAVNTEERLVKAKLEGDVGQGAEMTTKRIMQAVKDAELEATIEFIRRIDALEDDCECTQDESQQGLTGLWLWMNCIVGGLLGSSCCAIQLVINALTSLEIISGVGCTGFNKVLGPVRTHTRIATGALLAYSWWRARRARRPKGNLLVATVVFLVLTLLPEILVWSGGPALAPPTHDTQILNVNIKGMGCEACQRHVKGVLDSSAGVIGSVVNLKQGTAQILVAKGWGRNEYGGLDPDSVSRKLEKNGFSISFSDEQKNEGKVCDKSGGKCKAESNQK